MYTSIQMRIYTYMYLVVRRGHGRELGAAVGAELLKVERQLHITSHESLATCPYM